MNGEERRFPWLHGLVVAGLVLLAYGRAGGFEFVNYDDPAVVQGNPVQSWGDLPRAFTERMAHAWLPLYSLSLGLDNILFGPGRPGAYHLHSIVLHAFNSVLVMFLLHRFGARPWAALAGGSLFGLHPAVTESVAWVASRKDLLSFAFAAGSALVFLRAERDPRRPGLHAAGALLLGLGMLAKGTVVVVPALLVLAVLGRTEAGPERRRGLLATIPYFAVAAGLAAVHLAVARLEGTAGVAPGPGDGLGARVTGGLAAMGMYLRFLVFPVGSSVEHGLTPASATATGAVLGAVLLVGTLGGAVLLWRKGRRAESLLLAGVIVALAPFNGVFPRTSVLFAERYLYVSAALAAALGGVLLQRIPSYGTPLALVRPGVMILFILVTMGRLPTWRDSVTLWENAVAHAPTSHLARAKLGEALTERALAASDSAERGRLFDRAVEEHRRAVELAASPVEQVRASQALGVALLGAGEPGEAVSALRGALEAVPAAGDAVTPEYRAGLRVNLAKALEESGETAGAVAVLEALVAAYPTAAPAWLNLGVLRLRAGDAEGARAALLAATAAEPSLTAARLALADLEALGGDFATALRVAVKAAEEDPRDAAAALKCGEIASLLGQPARSEEWFRKALALAPGSAAAKRGLAGAALHRSGAALSEGRIDAAAEAAREAARLDPGGPEPRLALGDALRAGGDLEGALRAYAEAAARGAGPETRDARAAVRVVQALAARARGEVPRSRELVEAALAEDPSRIQLGGKRPALEEGLERVPDPPAGGEARPLVLDGILALANGETGAAVAALSGAIGTAARDPASRALLPAARVLRSRARLAVNEVDGALEDLEALAEENPEDARARFLLGHTLSTRAGLRRARGDAAGAAADGTRAVELLESARRVDPALEDASIALAERHFVEGRWIDAIRELNGVLGRDPGRVEAHLVLGNIMSTQFAEVGDRSYLREGEEHFRRALAADPGEARALAGLGKLSWFAGAFREALGYTQRALVLDPDLTEARSLAALLFVKVGRSHLEAGDPEAALEAARRADALGGETAPLCLLRAEVHREKGEWARAGTEVERARSLAPDDPEVRDALAAHYRDVGYAFLLHRRRDQAEEAFRRALAADPPRVDLSEVRRLLDHGLRDPPEEGSLPEGSPAFGAALEAAVDEARGLFEEGVAALREGRAGDAEGKFRASLRAWETSHARFGLGVALGAQGDGKGAEEAWRRALADDPTHADSWLELGGLLYREGRDREAEEAYREYLKWAPREGAEETVRKVENLVLSLRRRAAGEGPGPGKEER